MQIFQQTDDKGWCLGALVSFADIRQEKGNVFSKEVSNLSAPTGLSLIAIN